MAKVISAAGAAALIGDGMTVAVDGFIGFSLAEDCLLYTSPSPRD